MRALIEETRKHSDTYTFPFLRAPRDPRTSAPHQSLRTLGQTLQSQSGSLPQTPLLHLGCNITDNTGLGNSQETIFNTSQEHESTAGVRTKRSRAPQLHNLHDTKVEEFSSRMYPPVGGVTGDANIGSNPGRCYSTQSGQCNDKRIV